MPQKQNSDHLIQYWDSCLFICFLMNLPAEAERVDTLRELIRLAQNDRLTIVLSNLVLAEVRTYADQDTESRRIVDELFDTNRPYLQFYALTRSIALRAREFGQQHRSLTVPDAIHLATAAEANVDAFLTYDGWSEKKQNVRSDKLLGLDGQIGTPPLRIQLPQRDLGPLFRTSASAASKTGGQSVS